MSVMNKPDYKIFAQDAKSGEYVAFPDILRGWGITLEQYNGFPPMELFNSAAKRIDEWLMYLTQRGLPEWDAAVDYPKDAMIQHAGVYYVSLKVTKGEQPNNSQASWKKLTEALGVDGKLAKDQNGADIPNKPKFIENLGLPEKYLSLSGGTITGSTIISRSWEALKISATAPGAAHFIRLADTSGNTASLGFLSDNSNNLSLNNEKTSTMFHIADGEIRVNTKRCLTTDDLSAAVPVGGSVIWNSSSPIPANFWKHDGRSFSASEYPEAAKVFTDLKVPKDGGYFLRIADDGAGVDPGRQVGTYQEDAARKLEGKIALRSVGNAGETLYFPTGAFNTAKPAGINARAMSPMNDDINNGGMDLLIDSSRVWPTASEFRPKNVSKYLIVRMK